MLLVLRCQSVCARCGVQYSPEIEFSYSDGSVDVEHESLKTTAKPLLDQDAFQQLLAAAYTLQTQRDRLPTECIETTPRPLESGEHGRLRVTISEQPLPKSGLSLHQTATLNAGGSHRKLRTRIFRSNEFFWRTAMAVGAVAVAALLFGASVNSIAPLPAGITVPPEFAQQEIPFHRAHQESTDGARRLHRRNNSVPRGHAKTESSD